MDTEAVSISPSTINEIKRKMYFTGTIVKTTLAGAIVDIGLDTPGVVHISQLQKEPVNHVQDVVQVGQKVDVWVRRVFPNKGRIDLTMIKPLDLEWRDMNKDMVLSGKVVRLEKFGAFVDIGAERPGLVHISEMTHDYIRTPGDVVKEGDVVEVKVLEVNRQKKQIRLSMKALEAEPEKVIKAALTRSEKKSKEKETKAAGPAAEEKEEPAPTAMEMALREAMDRVQDKEEEPVEKGKKKSAQNDELEDILSRTLSSRVATK